MRELFTIIPKLPGVRVFQFTDDPEKSRELAEFCEAMGHSLEVVTFDDHTFEALKDLPVRVRRLQESKERYNQRSMQFDTIFIDYTIEKLQNVEDFFRKVYRMSKNGGDIIFPIAPSREEEMVALLTELNFVAINSIESEGRLYLTAKKLHGWARV
ncbi:MAG: methyltransferase domain-containing protein [Epsilonproteobacteria bacterium]|nr:hypothetical protein [Campylobacterota bacterium]NPA56961.1 methyltransferase domain-containing protein [Campylobacterota bacterium]